MSDQPKKRGPKPRGQQPKRAINFWVDADAYAWLTALGNRSAWLAAHVAADRAAQHETGTRSSPDCAADRAPSAPDARREAS